MPYHDPFHQNQPHDCNNTPETAFVGRQHACHGQRASFIPALDPGSRPFALTSSQQTPSKNTHSQASEPRSQHQAQFQASDRSTDNVASTWFDNATAKRINTDMQMYKTLLQQYPGSDVQVLDTDAYNVNILAYVSATGDGTIESLSYDAEVSVTSNGQFELKGDFAGAGRTNGTKPACSGSARHSNVGEDTTVPQSMSWVNYYPPSRRLEGGRGVLAADPKFERFLLKWHKHEFEVIVVDTRDGTALYFQKRQYIRTTDMGAALELIRVAGDWQDILHGEIWIFDQGFWQKSQALYQSVQKSRWSDIILPEDLKEDLLKTVLRFYDSRDTYSKLRVPWKRGIILYGPPGNGKTVSIKATMKTLLDRSESIPTLYVKSLVSWAGPEAAITDIFEKARQQAPCYLVFEDLDSLIGDDVRSFFLNAVDGLSENEGILMVGSTNHLDRLDPGIAKRPSRFDRKYLFPDPAVRERRKYCQYWQKKLKGNSEVEFPDKLLSPIAALLDGFSFAYMQEAFVSTLLKIANDEQGKETSANEEPWDIVDELEDLEIVGYDKGGDDDSDELDKYILWREIKVQIANLKKEIDRGDD